MESSYYSTKVDVRYAETDQMGVVYYANYFVWMEIARTRMLKDYGLPYSRLEKMGILLPVREAFCKYIKPAYYEDIIEIRCYIDYVKISSIKISYEIYNEEAILLATGYTIHPFTNRELRVIKTPEIFLKAISKRG